MNTRIAQMVAALSVIALSILLWLAGTGAPGPDGPPPPAAGTLLLENPDGGSAVPCALPLRWRVARIDDRFGVDAAAAEAAVDAAASLWEDAVGRTLFVHDPSEGFPIRFTYDERQARTRDRRAAEAELADVDAALQARRSEVERMGRELAEASDRYGERARSFRERLSTHNDSVRSWNAAGGVPVDLVQELDARGDSLESEGVELSARQEELQERRAELQRAQEELQRSFDERQRRVSELERAFPPQPVESGLYREAVHTEDGRLLSVDREIRIYRFEGRDDLRRILAHELGHALGLGHVEVPGALMSEEYARAGALAAEGATPGEADLVLFRETCPDL